MSKALQKQEAQALGAPNNPITALFRRFDKNRYNVLAPTTHMESLPTGTRLAVTEIAIDPSPQNKEVFPIAGGALLIGKVGLDRIAAASGISWIDEKRMDDHRHPHYCEMMVRGRIVDFDGTVREITGTKAIDLRADASGEPGKDYNEIVTKARNAKPKPRDPSNQLMEARKFIVEVAASKARNRAIASALGIKRSYTAQELRRPFVVPKLIVDTNSHAGQQAVLASLTGATEALFGKQQQVIDATFEEPEPGSPGDLRGDGQGAGAGGSWGPHGEDITGQSVSPVPAEPPHDQTSGELAGTPEVKAAIGKVWVDAKAAGLDGPSFKVLCNTATSKESSDQMTMSDVEDCARSLKKFIANQAGGDCPL